MKKVDLYGGLSYNRRKESCEVNYMPTTFPENFINIEAAAKYLNIKPVTLRKWVKDRKVPAHQIGKQWKFKISELDAWINSGESAIKDKSESAKL